MPIEVIIDEKSIRPQIEPEATINVIIDEENIIPQIDPEATINVIIDGKVGPRGHDGIGVALGGLKDQILAKNSNADGDTKWIDPPRVEPLYPVEGNIGDVLMKTSSDRDGAGWVTPASSAEQDNTRPITAAAVYTEIGNINALLATI